RETSTIFSRIRRSSLTTSSASFYSPTTWSAADCTRCEPSRERLTGSYGAIELGPTPRGWALDQMGQPALRLGCPVRHHRPGGGACWVTSALNAAKSSDES